MAGLKLQFTEAGLAKLLSAKENGLKGEITHIAFGDGSYTPSKTQTKLSREMERIELTDYQDYGSSLRISGVFNGDLEYAIREIGVFLSDGTLLGAYSLAGKTLGYRTPAIKVAQWLTINVEALPADSVTVVVGTENLNLIIDLEMMMDAVAFTRSQVVQTKQAHTQMQLGERLRKLEAVNV